MSESVVMFIDYINSEVITKNMENCFCFAECKFYLRCHDRSVGTAIRHGFDEPRLDHL